MVGDIQKFRDEIDAFFAFRSDYHCECTRSASQNEALISATDRFDICRSYFYQFAIPNRTLASALGSMRQRAAALVARYVEHLLMMQE